MVGAMATEALAGGPAEIVARVRGGVEGDAGLLVGVSVIVIFSPCNDSRVIKRWFQRFLANKVRLPTVSYTS